MPDSMAVRGAVCAMSLALPGIAFAAPYTADLQVSVDVQRSRSEISFDAGGDADLSYTRLSANVRETSLSWFQPGLNVGTGWLDVDGDPRSDDQSFSGESGGLTLRSRIPLVEPLSLAGDVSWIYNDLSDGDFSYQWYDTTAQAGLVADLRRVRLAAGGAWRHIDGEQRAPRAGNRDFEAADAAGVYASIGVRLSGGLVSVRGETGSRDAVEVSFSRRF